MTNAEKYKTAEERIHKFREYCRSHACLDCPANSSSGNSRECAILWLELSVAKHLPCPFCGSTCITHTIQKKDKEIFYGVKCAVCGAKAPLQKTKEDAVEAWNRRVR